MAYKVSAIFDIVYGFHQAHGVLGAAQQVCRFYQRFVFFQRHQHACLGFLASDDGDVAIVIYSVKFGGKIVARFGVGDGVHGFVLKVHLSIVQKQVQMSGFLSGEQLIFE